MSGHQPDTSLQRHKSLYFDDGDIVLAAPTKGYPDRRTMFRVDKIYLARNSPIFRDMLSFSPGQEPHDTYDCVPRVDLADEAEDLQGLLGAMYNAAYVSPIPPLLHAQVWLVLVLRTLPLRRFDPDKPLLLMGTMRLAIKYEVDGIRDIIKRSVEEDWPHDSKSYPTWLAEIARIKRNHHGDWFRRVPEPAAALQFATEFECSDILVGIIYYITTLGTQTEIYIPTLRPRSIKQLQRVRWHLLDANNMFRVIRAQEIIKENMESYEEEALSEIELPECCQLDHSLRVFVYPDIMRSYSSVINIYTRYGACETCLGQLHDEASFEEWKSSMWEELGRHATAVSLPWWVSSIAFASNSH